jgi:hypothetical protein
MRRWCVLGVSAAVALTGWASLGAGTGTAGALPGTLELELGYGSERPVGLPLSRPDVSADTAQAIQEIEARRKAAALGRENPPRPDLDHDVTQGIQSRGVDRAISR